MTIHKETWASKKWEDRKGCFKKASHLSGKDASKKPHTYQERMLQKSFTPIRKGCFKKASHLSGKDASKKPHTYQERMLQKSLTPIRKGCFKKASHLSGKDASKKLHTYQERMLQKSLTPIRKGCFKKASHLSGKDASKKPHTYQERMLQKSLTPIRKGCFKKASHLSGKDASKKPHTYQERMLQKSLTPIRKDASKKPHTYQERMLQKSLTPIRKGCFKKASHLSGKDASKKPHTYQERMLQKSLTPIRKGCFKKASHLSGKDASKKLHTYQERMLQKSLTPVSLLWKLITHWRALAQSPVILFPKWKPGDKTSKQTGAQFFKKSVWYRFLQTFHSNSHKISNPFFPNSNTKRLKRTLFNRTRQNQKIRMLAVIPDSNIIFNLKKSNTNFKLFFKSMTYWFFCLTKVKSQTLKDLSLINIVYRLSVSWKWLITFCKLWKTIGTLYNEGSPLVPWFWSACWAGLCTWRPSPWHSTLAGPESSQPAACQREHRPLSENHNTVQNYSTYSQSVPGFLCPINNTGSFHYKITAPYT